MLHMHAAGWEDGEGRDTAGRLQSGLQSSPAGPGEEKLAAVTQCKIKVPKLDSGRKKVLGEMKEQSRLSVPTPAWPLPFLHHKYT